MKKSLIGVPPARRYKVPMTEVPRKIQDQNNMFMSILEKYPNLDLGITHRRPDLPYFTDN